MGRTKAKKTPLMTPEQAAEQLGVNEKTLARWRLQGGGPRFVRISKRCVRYRLQDLETWTESRLRRSTSDPGADEPWV